MSGPVVFKSVQISSGKRIISQLVEMEHRVSLGIKWGSEQRKTNRKHPWALGTTFYWGRQVIKNTIGNITSEKKGIKIKLIWVEAEKWTTLERLTKGSHRLL